MRKACLENDTEAQTELEKLPHQKRGEFGELLLHLLLRDFHGTIPLISKVYFKDSTGVPAHGFDAVHISPDIKTLWLGESKFYADSKQGINGLIEDIKEHFKKDYLNDQVTIIKKNLDANSVPQRDYWIKTLNECSKLKDTLNIINIPLLCIYPNDIYAKFNDWSTQESFNYHETNIRDLKAFFDKKNDHPLKAELNIIFMLFPVRDKQELIAKLHERLWHMQSI
jgi:hypothetical protein